MINYDVIIVGARCAGSPTAMLLARYGYRVLLVDRGQVGSDTMSTHWIHQPGLAALQRWELLDRVRATGAPSIGRVSFDLGPFVLTGSAPPIDGVRDALAPRRYLLDRILVEAAAEAGADVRDQFSVSETVVENGRVVGIRGHRPGGGSITERAHLVIGADGLHSRIARLVGAEEHSERPPLSFAYYAYFSGVDSGLVIYNRPGRGVALIPTNHGQHCVLVAGRQDQATEFKRDLEHNYLTALDRVGDAGDRVRTGRREERIVGFCAANYYRKPYGPGWALVGDAGYHKDPVTAQGITDAFHGAESLAAAVHAWLSGGTPYEVALGAYERRRDQRTRPMYEFTCELAALDPPPPERVAMFQALAGDQAETDRFFGVLAGTVSVPEFFAQNRAVAPA